MILYAQIAKLKQSLPLNKNLVFTVNDVLLIAPDFRRPTLYDWESRDLVTKLRNNHYIFSDFTPADKDFYSIANKIYRPSYVSLESALKYYSVIPEEVFVTTSITTNKTNAFATPVGDFSYASVLEKLYFGYQPIPWKYSDVLVAHFEKAILDYIYLHPSLDSVVDFESLRWNRRSIKENINSDRFATYFSIFDNDSLKKRVEVFKEYINA